MGDPVCTFPEAGGISETFCVDDSIWWLNHPLYQLVSCPIPTTMKRVSFNSAEQAYITAMHTSFFVAQSYLASLAADPTGNYCLVPQVQIGGLTLYLPVPPAPGGCGTFKRVYIPPAKWAEVTAAFNDMDCANTYIRENFLP